MTWTWLRDTVHSRGACGPDLSSCVSVTDWFHHDCISVSVINLEIRIRINGNDCCDWRRGPATEFSLLCANTVNLCAPFLFLLSCVWEVLMSTETPNQTAFMLEPVLAGSLSAYGLSCLWVVLCVHEL